MENLYPFWGGWGFPTQIRVPSVVNLDVPSIEPTQSAPPAPLLVLRRVRQLTRDAPTPLGTAGHPAAGTQRGKGGRAFRDAAADVVLFETRDV